MLFKLRSGSGKSTRRTFTLRPVASETAVSSGVRSRLAHSSRAQPMTCQCEGPNGIPSAVAVRSARSGLHESGANPRVDILAPRAITGPG